MAMAIVECYIVPFDRGIKSCMGIGQLLVPACFFLSLSKKYRFMVTSLVWPDPCLFLFRSFFCYGSSSLLFILYKNFFIHSEWEAAAGLNFFRSFFWLLPCGGAKIEEAAAIFAWLACQGPSGSRFYSDSYSRFLVVIQTPIHRSGHVASVYLCVISLYSSKASLYSTHSLSFRTSAVSKVI